jgi:hypothetical protein
MTAHLAEATMALGDEIRKKKRLEKKEADDAAREKKEAAVALKGKWLGNVAKDVEGQLKNYKGGHFISIPHSVAYKDGITFDEIKTTAGFKALRTACEEHNVSAYLVQKSSRHGFEMHVELLPETEFSKNTLSKIDYRT